MSLIMKKYVPTENGRVRILEVTAIQQDIATKRLKAVDKSAFVYHMKNNCDKNYTHKKNL